MAAISLHTHPNSFDCGKCNLKKNCGYINISCSIKNLLKYLIYYVYLAFIYHTFHVTPHNGIWRLRCGNRGGQFCGPPQPIHRSGNCSFRYSLTFPVICVGEGVPPHAGSVLVVVMPIFLNDSSHVIIKETRIQNAYPCILHWRMQTAYFYVNDMKTRPTARHDCTVC